MNQPAENDMVNHPGHYISNSGMEVINIIEAFTENLNGIEAVDTANIIKYVCRWKNKNGVEDLKKARWYLDNLIAHLESIGNVPAMGVVENAAVEILDGKSALRFSVKDGHVFVDGEPGIKVMYYKKSSDSINLYLKKG